MSKKNPAKINLYVRVLETDELVHTVPVSHPHTRRVEKVMRGMLINMNTDKFYIDDHEADGLA